MPIPENAINVIYLRSKSDKMNSLLESLLQDQNAPPSVLHLKDPDMKIEFYPQEKNLHLIDEMLSKLNESCGVTQLDFNKYPFEQLFPDIEYGRGLLDIALQYFFHFLPHPFKEGPKGGRRLLWNLANQDSYGFIIPLEYVESTVDEDDLELPARQEIELSISENYPRKRQQLMDHLHEKISYLADYSHSFKLTKIRELDHKALIGLYNFSVIETLIRSSSTVSLVLPKLSGAIFKEIHKNLRFAPVYYTVYAESWKDKQSVVLSFNLEGYFSKRINRSNSYLSQVLLKKIVPSLLENKMDFLLLLMCKFKNDFRVIHLNRDNFTNTFWPWELPQRSDEAAANDWLQNPKAEPIYDSELEQNFFEAFDLYFGAPWILEREPETITTEFGKIFLPDFLITNGLEKIYLEVVGFWTEKYIVKKQQKISEFIEMEAPPNLIFFVDVQLKKHFVQFLDKDPQVSFIFFKQNKVPKAVQELKSLCRDKYAPKVLLRDEINSILKDNVLWTKAMEYLKRELLLSLEEFAKIAKEEFKTRLEPDMFKTLKLSPKFFEKEFDTPEYRELIERSPHNLKYIKGVGFLSKINFNQLKGLVPEIFETDEKLSKMEYVRRIKKKIPNIPFDPLLLIEDHSDYKLEWRGLMDVFVVKKTE